MSFFNEIVFEKKWDLQVWLLFTLAGVAFAIELTELFVHIDEEFHLFGVVPEGANVVCVEPGCIQADKQ